MNTNNLFSKIEWKKHPITEVQRKKTNGFPQINIFIYEFFHLVQYDHCYHPHPQHHLQHLSESSASSTTQSWSNQHSMFNVNSSINNNFLLAFDCWIKWITIKSKVEQLQELKAKHKTKASYSKVKVGNLEILTFFCFNIFNCYQND